MQAGGQQQNFWHVHGIRVHVYCLHSRPLLTRLGDSGLWPPVVNSEVSKISPYFGRVCCTTDGESPASVLQGNRHNVTPSHTYLAASNDVGQATRQGAPHTL
jgi:hypothetical protein